MSPTFPERMKRADRKDGGRYRLAAGNRKGKDVLNRQIRKSSFIQFLIAAVCVILILCVYPLRLFHFSAGYGTGALLSRETEPVRNETSVGEYLSAQGPHLDTVRVYITRWEKGTSLSFDLYDVTENGYGIIAHEHVETNGETGWISIPVDVDTEPGGKYFFVLGSGRKYTGDWTSILAEQETSFSLGLQIPSADNTDLLYSFYHPVNPMVETSIDTYHAGGEDTGIDGYLLMVQTDYSYPYGPKRSLLVIAVAAVIAAVLMLLVRKIADRRPEQDTSVRFGTALAKVLRPVVIILTVLGMISAWPVKLYDVRATDNALYFCGFALTGLVLLLLFRKMECGTGKTSAPAKLSVPERISDLIAVVSAAFMIRFGCAYMNSLSDLDHALAERKMMAAFLVLMAGVLGVSVFRTYGTAILAAAGTLGGFFWYRAHRLGPEEKEFAEHNTVTMLGIVCAVLLALVLLGLVRTILRKRREGKHVLPKLCRWYAIPLGIFLVLICVFSNTRTWAVVFAVTFALFWLCAGVTGKQDRVLRLVTEGLVLQFGCTVIWCLARRYFMSYYTIRFPMQFFTVTVTAEYLTMILAVSVPLLIAAVGKALRMPRADRFYTILPAAVLFGTAGTYLLFTMARTGFLAVLFLLLIVFVVVTVTAAGRKEQNPVLRTIGVMVLSVLIGFPSLFTLQRCMPALVQKPYTYDIEHVPETIKRRHRVGSFYYACIERFADLFSARVFGTEQHEYDYYKSIGVEGENEALLPADTETLPENVSVLPETDAVLSAKYQITGITEPLVLVASAGTADIPAGQTVAADDGGDYSNGRLSIWKQYLGHLNLTGHTEMGVPLENGEISVHAHNTFLQAAFDFGVPTGIVFLLVLFLTFIRSCLYYKFSTDRSGLSLIPLASVTGFAAAGLVEWMFQQSNPACMILFLMMTPLLFDRKET